MSGYNYENCPQGIVQDEGKDNVNYLFLFDYISKLLQHKDKVRILEVGTGGGRNLYAIHRRFNDKVEVYGTDISETSIAYAGKMKIGTFAVAKSNEIPFAVQFDLILFVDIIEHLLCIDDVTSTIESALQYLNPAGALYLSVPIELNRYSLTWVFSKIPYLRRLTYLFFGHVLQFDKDEVLRLVEPRGRVLCEFYSAHYFTQLQMLIFFYIPKILIKLLFGEKVSSSLRDSNEQLGTGKASLLQLFKKAVLSLIAPLKFLAFKESVIRRNSSFGASNLSLLLKNPE